MSRQDGIILEWNNTRNVKSVPFLGIVIGLNLSSQGQERAKQYAKNNQLLYAGTADLYNRDEVQRISSKALKAQWQNKKNLRTRLLRILRNSVKKAQGIYT